MGWLLSPRNITVGEKTAIFAIISSDKLDVSDTYSIIYVNGFIELTKD